MLPYYIDFILKSYTMDELKGLAALPDRPKLLREVVAAFEDLDTGWAAEEDLQRTCLAIREKGMSGPTIGTF